MGIPSDHLLEDVQKLGEDKFTREILHYCESKGVLSYPEAQEQSHRRVLETDEYYNGIDPMCWKSQNS